MCVCAITVPNEFVHSPAYIFCNVSEKGGCPVNALKA